MPLEGDSNFKKLKKSFAKGSELKNKTLGIIGFGRIGRLVMRAAIEAGRGDIEFVGINDLGDTKSNAHLLKYDTVHGRLANEITTGDDWMDVGKGKIKVTAERDPAKLPWKELDVDIAMECTGIFTDADAARRHIAAGAAKVLVSAPSRGADATIVYGVNEDVLTGDMTVVSNASCTTNCLAPVARILHESCGILQGFMTTVHAYTGDQNLIDGDHKDPYRARAAAINMVPSTTGAARAVGLVLPDLAGKLDGVAIRVPTPNVSAVDLVFQPRDVMDADALNAVFVAASKAADNGVFEVTDRPLVSSDFNHNPASSILHLDQTRVMPDGMTRVLAWYDNEWGFSNRMLDTAGAILQT